MLRKSIIQGLAAVWLVLVVVSFVALEVLEADGSAASTLNRAASFLTWQVIALVVAAVGAFATRQAVVRGIERIKLVGYAPLALSVFFVALFVAVVAFRVFVVPLWEGG